METPCVGICTYFPGLDVCAGCLRTREEIFLWSSFTDAQRADCIDRLKHVRKVILENYGGEEPT